MKHTKGFMVLAILFLACANAHAIGFNLALSAESIATQDMQVVSQDMKQQKLAIAPLVTGIILKGNVTVPQEKIFELIITKIGENLSQDKLKTDQRAIYSLGVFSDVSVEFEKTKAGTNIIFRVKENPVLADIKIEGNSVFTSEALLKIMKSKAGKALSYSNIQEDLKTLEDYYKKNGYMHAR